MKARWLAGVAAASMALPVAAQQTDSPTTRIYEAAEALVASFGPAGGGGPMGGGNRRAGLMLEADDPNREQWTYWPTERAGLPLELMTARQRLLTHDLLLSVLSSTGYLKVLQIMQLEDYLKVNDEIGFQRDVGHYTVAFFGEPSLDTPWSWRFEGHHVSLNIAVAPDAVTVTPTFLGTNPGEMRTGSLAGLRVLAVEEDLGRELVTSLTDAQRTQAVISDRAPNDILTGNFGKQRPQWDAWKQAVQPEGIAVADLNEVQQHWVRRILDEVVRTYRPEISASHLEAIDVESLHFAWMGSTERRQPHYYRLQGDDFVFELDNVQDQANHVHAVWRSKGSDFGSDLLAQHYQVSHD